MTYFEFKFDLPERLAKEAQAAGLLTRRAVTQLLKQGLAKQAAAEMRKGTENATANGSDPMLMQDIQAEINAVRGIRKAKSAKTV